MDTPTLPEDIFDSRNIIETPFSLEWWQWGLIALGMLATAFIIYYLIKQTRNKPSEKTNPKLSAYETANLELEAIQQSIAGLLDKKFSILLSNTLRNYLENELNAPAPERTTEEFLIEIRRFPQIQGMASGLLFNFLKECDLVKFAKHKLEAEDRRRLFQSAQEVIQEVHSKKIEEERKTAELEAVK